MWPFISLALLLPLAQAHMTAWTDGMYCMNGTSGVDDQNNNDPVQPLWNLTKSDWWMHHFNQCDEFPPAEGRFLEVPAGGEFTVQIADNRAHTTYSYNGQYTSAWGDGKDHPAGYSITNLGDQPNPSDSGCIPSPNMHTQNETMAAGTVFAISYQSKLEDVTAENLVVFTVKYHTPYMLNTTYQVPTDLPACPEGGCHCVFGWQPNHCGEPNMYMMPHRCIVTGATNNTTTLAPAVPPVWCESDQTQCVQGAKQMVFYNQLDGNNIILQGYQADGDEKSPGYNTKMGFIEGAQDDIFVIVTDPADTTTSVIPTSTDTPTATSQPAGVAVALVDPPTTTTTSMANTTNSGALECVSMRPVPNKKRRHFLHRRGSRH